MSLDTTVPQSPIPNAQSLSSVRDYVALMKPGVMSLVVFTGLAGMLLAQLNAAVPLNRLQQCLTLACIALGSGAGAAINMWYDRDIDAIMKRTQKRPIPSGRIAADDALAFGLFLAALSVMLMSLALNSVAALLLAGAIAFYAVIYTAWLKRRTPQNIVIGGAAGAFPPMIGWAAVTGTVTLESVLLFAIIFLWTPPHFWALALYRNGDYARAGVPMLPVVAGADATKRQMIAYMWALTLVSMSLPLLQLGGMIYTASAAILNGVFLYHLYKTKADATDAWPKKTFGFSILYLFMLFTVLMLDGWWSRHMNG
jgi:protoheme IX farnesyltransferase